MAGYNDGVQSSSFERDDEWPGDVSWLPPDPWRNCRSLQSSNLRTNLIGTLLFIQALKGVKHSEAALVKLGAWSELIEAAQNATISQWELDPRAQRREHVQRVLNIYRYNNQHATSNLLPSGRIETKYVEYFYTLEFWDWVDEVEDSFLSLPDPYTNHSGLYFQQNSEFLKSSDRISWLIDGLLMEHGACVIGGPSKSFKTALAVALATSLASGRPFLGRWRAETALNVGVITGEEHPAAILRLFRRICQAEGIDDPESLGINWMFDMPNLLDPAHLDDLSYEIFKHELNVLILDPFYLALQQSKNRKVNVNSMFSMGRVLDDFAEACLRVNCTPVLVHHYSKSNNTYEIPELSDLAHSGCGQFARQWILLGHREPFDSQKGLARLHFRYGGSAGHAGLCKLDLEVGRVGDDGSYAERKWSYKLADADSQPAGAAQARLKATAERAKTIEESASEALQIIVETLGSQTTIRGFRDTSGWNKSRAEKTLAELVRRGDLRKQEIDIAVGRGGMRSYSGYVVVNRPEATQ